jgi:selenoprotein W-related protein
MSTIEIEYCVPCGLRENALATADDLLDTFARDVDDVRLVPGDSGIFQVRADGTVVFDKSESGYDPAAIEAAVRERVEA